MSLTLESAAWTGETEKKCDAIFLAWLAGRPVGIAQQGPATLQGLAGLTKPVNQPSLHC